MAHICLIKMSSGDRHKAVTGVTLPLAFFMSFRGMWSRSFCFRWAKGPRGSCKVTLFMAVVLANFDAARSMVSKPMLIFTGSYRRFYVPLPKASKSLKKKVFGPTTTCKMIIRTWSRSCSSPNQSRT
jgi:hypothetical protein